METVDCDCARHWCDERYEVATARCAQTWATMAWIMWTLPRPGHYVSGSAGEQKGRAEPCSMSSSNRNAPRLSGAPKQKPQRDRLRAQPNQSSRTESPCFSTSSL